MRRQLVDKLLEQACYKSAAGLLQLVRFYACSLRFQSGLSICLYTRSSYMHMTDFCSAKRSEIVSAIGSFSTEVFTGFITNSPCVNWQWLLVFSCEYIISCLSNDGFEIAQTYCVNVDKNIVHAQLISYRPITPRMFDCHAIILYARKTVHIISWSVIYL